MGERRTTDHVPTRAPDTASVQFVDGCQLPIGEPDAAWVSSGTRGKADAGRAVGIGRSDWGHIAIVPKGEQRPAGVFTGLDYFHPLRGWNPFGEGTGGQH